MVQLVGKNMGIIKKIINSFNSNMVQLVVTKIQSTYLIFQAFKFQYGAISGRFNLRIVARLRQFQFQYGAISGP